MKRLTMTKRLRLTSLLVCVCLTWAGLACADVVSDWNAIASQTAIPVRPGPSAILDLAMVHAAMHDAIQAFQGRFEPYGAPIPNATGSPVAAAARAAHDVLVARFPSQSGALDTLLDNYLIGLGLQGDAGLLIGQQAAANSDNFLALWERTLRGIADTNLHNIGDSARLFALANLATADALITAWDGKRLYHFWRPITAIQNGNDDGNPRTAGDATWLPQIPTNTPPYPEYPSGANNLTGAMTRTLERFFGNKMTFSVFSAFVNQTKTYQHFSDMADDVVNVRIYQGIHFRTADVIARRHGTRIAQMAFSHFLRPTHNHDDDDDR
jgi:hypothetical protein